MAAGPAKGRRPMEFNLADLFEAVADAVPEREAAVCGDRRVTYAELDERATRFANGLREAGVGPDDHVGLYLYNSIEHLEAMLACYKLRAVPDQRQLPLRRRRARVSLRRRGSGRRRASPRVRVPSRAGGASLPATRPRRDSRRRHRRAAGVVSIRICVRRRRRARCARTRCPACPAPPTTTTCSTPAARPAGPRESSGARKTSSSAPWEAGIRAVRRSRDPKRSWRRSSTTPRNGCAPSSHPATPARTSSCPCRSGRSCMRAASGPRSAPCSAAARSCSLQTITPT